MAQERPERHRRLAVYILAMWRRQPTSDRLTLRSERPPDMRTTKSQPIIAQNTYFVQQQRTAQTCKNACFTSLFRACVDAPKIFCEIRCICPPLTYREVTKKPTDSTPISSIGKVYKEVCFLRLKILLTKNFRKSPKVLDKQCLLWYNKNVDTVRLSPHSVLQSDFRRSHSIHLYYSVFSAQSQGYNDSIIFNLAICTIGALLFCFICNTLRIYIRQYMN